LISFVVATPLELRFFQREIDTQLAQNRTDERRKAGEDVDAEFAEITTLQAENDDLRKGIDDARKKYAAADTLAIRESLGQAGYTTVVGEGRVFHLLRVQADELKRLAEQTEKTNGEAISRNDRRIAKLEAEKQERLRQRVDAIENSGGFLNRYRALGQMAKANVDVQAARLFLMLLVLAVELTPVITKLLLRRGPYDDYTDTHEHEVRVTEMTKRSHMNDDAHTEVALHSRDNTERIELEKALTNQTFDIVTVEKLAPAELEEAQRKLIRASIRQWSRKQMMNVDPNAVKLPIRKPPTVEQHEETPPS
jgi:hypothetical protein